MTKLQQHLRRQIDEHGSITLRLHRSTPFTWATVKALINAGYKASRTNPHDIADNWLITKGN